MSVNNFIPIVWASRTLLNLHKAQVWGQPSICNRDYEGEIQQFGDRVRIGAIGAVTINTYTKNVDMAAPQTIDDASTVLVIDQSKYANFAIDDVDRRQTQPDLMDNVMQETAYALSNDADSFISNLVASVAAANTIGTDTVPKTDTAPSSGFSKAYDYLVDLGVLLRNANVPYGQWWVVVPPWYHGLLQRDDRFVKFGTPPQQDILKNGIVGRAAGFDVYVSNNIYMTNTTTYNITAGYPGAMSYADNIVEMIAYRPEKRFGDAIKCLHLYGAKVVRPQGLAVLKATDPGF